jgi:hypothetical protein
VLTTEIESLVDTVIICDYIYWSKNYKRIMRWYLESNDTELNVSGMIIKFNNSEDRTLFLLKWACD